MSPLTPPPASLLERYRGEQFLPLYTTTVAVTGGESGPGRASGVARWAVIVCTKPLSGHVQVYQLAISKSMSPGTPGSIA